MGGAVIAYMPNGGLYAPPRGIHMGYSGRLCPPHQGKELTVRKAPTVARGGSCRRSNNDFAIAVCSLYKSEGWPLAAVRR
jgi:hypothetical protein